MSVPKEQNVWILNEKPAGEVQDNTFKLLTQPIPELKDGQVIVKIEYISNDPAQRGWISKGADPVSYDEAGQRSERSRGGGGAVRPVIDIPLEDVWTSRTQRHVTTHSELAMKEKAECADTTQDRAYVPPVNAGEPMRAGGVGTIVASKSSKWAVGKRVYGYLGWADYAVVPEASVVMEAM